jgi:hypothetical protein
VDRIRWLRVMGVRYRCGTVAAENSDALGDAMSLLATFDIHQNASTSQSPRFFFTAKNEKGNMAAATLIFTRASSVQNPQAP